MRNSNPLVSRSSVKAPDRSVSLRGFVCAIALSAAMVSVSSNSLAATYNEGIQGDLSGLPSAPTALGTFSTGGNFVLGSSIPSGAEIPDGHGALTNQDNDFFTFVVPEGDVISKITLGSDTSIADGDRFFLGIYRGSTSPVDPSNPAPNGLLGYALPGNAQIGTDLLPTLAASDDPGFPPLPQHFSGSLQAGAYTVWVVDGDRPLNYDFNVQVAAAPEPGTWMLIMAAIGLTGITLRQRQRALRTTFGGGGLGAGAAVSSS